MDEIQRLGELLSANQRNEDNKHQRFHAGLAQWEAGIRKLYEQIEQWLAPLVSTGQIVTEYEPHLAQSKGYPDENSPFRTQRMTLSIAGQQHLLLPVQAQARRHHCNCAFWSHCIGDQHNLPTRYG